MSTIDNGSAEVAELPEYSALASLPCPRDSGFGLRTREDLPRYSAIGFLPTPASPVQNSPRYSTLFSSNEPTLLTSPEHSTSIANEHEFHPMKKGKPWATLRVQSKAGSRGNLSKIFLGDILVGSVIPNLDTADNIQAISVTVSSAFHPSCFPTLYIHR